MASSPFLPRVRTSQRTGETAELVAQINKLIDQYNGNFSGVDTDVGTAQTSANQSGVRAYGVLGKVVNSDPAGVFVAVAAPDGDTTVEFRENDMTTVLASRTVRGTMDTNGDWTISATPVASSGLATAHTISGDGSKSAKAVVSVTFADGTMDKADLTWSAVDESSGGLTPSSGGGK